MNNRDKLLKIKKWRVIKRASNTSNLKHHKWDIEIDGEQEFNINTALNKNWDKIDRSFNLNILSITLPSRHSNNK